MKESRLYNFFTEFLVPYQKYNPHTPLFQERGPSHVMRNWLVKVAGE